MSEQQRRLLRAIEDAFSGVELGDGVSLRETVLIDDYGGPDERLAARAADETHDWRKLLGDPDLARIVGVGGLNFYDAAGLRFHLPAYLSLAVTTFDQQVTGDVMESLLFHLTHLNEYNRARFSILNGAQRRCVRDVLIFLREEYELEDEELDVAVRGYWGSLPEAEG